MSNTPDTIWADYIEDGYAWAVQDTPPNITDMAQTKYTRADSQWRDIETAPKDGTEVDLYALCKNTGEGKRRPNCSWGEMSFAGGISIYNGWRGFRLVECSLYVLLHEDR